MNFQLLKKLCTIVVVVFLLLSHESELVEARNGTKTSAKIMKAFLMQCPENFSSRNNIQVTVRIAIKSTSARNNDSFVGKILLGELFDTNRNFACDLKAPSLVDVSIEDFVLMYPFKFETTVQATKETGTVIKPAYDKGAKTDSNLNHIEADKDVHTANNVKLLDDIYYTRLKPSDFLKRSDFMHTNPKDFRRDSICTKNFRKDNNKNNANNEYANEEFYGDKNQRENENAFSGKLGMNLNNNEIDNIMSNKRRNDRVYSIGYLTKNLFDDKDSWKRRKKINEHKNDFIKCVGMKNFKKIDHILCTCAGNVDDVYDVDETENGDDEQSDCFQLINNVCPWGPVYNKNINYEMEMNDDIRNVNYGNIKSTACCDLLPHFYFALGKRCYRTYLITDDLYDDTNNKLIQITDTKVLDKLPEIIKNESDDILDETTSYLRSNIEKDEKIIENKIHRSESLVNSPKYNLYSVNPSDGFKSKETRNRLNNERFINTKTVPLYDTVNALIKITNKPTKLRNFHKKEVKPFDKDIYDPHLNIADKMQLINMINPKRPCQRNRMNHQLSFHSRLKRNVEATDHISSSLTDDELDSALETYEDLDSQMQDGLKGGDYDSKEYSNINSASGKESMKKFQKICSQHPCALAMPFKKDPYFRGEVKFLANNGSNLNSTQIAENICHDHFNEFILIPFDYANGEN